MGIQYTITEEQTATILNHFKKDPNQAIENFELCELLDKIIDEICMNDMQ